MTKNNVLEFAGRDAISDPLTALLRSGAQQLITQAVEAELQELLSQYSDRRTDGAMPLWFAMVICRSATCRQAWGQ
jgi:hypothetical protein